MLKKLIRHEFRATRRFFLPAYGIFVILLVLERLSLLAAPLVEGESFFAMISSVTMGIVTALTVMGLIVLLAAPTVYNAIRFYRNMLGDEGYLSFTLPVTTDQLIISRLLTAVAWQFLTAILVGLLGGAFIISLEPAEFAGMFQSMGAALGDALSRAGIWVPVIALEMIAGMLINAASQILAMYSAMSIGQTANKHKLLASFGAYLGINTVISWVMQTGAVILMLLGSRLRLGEMDQVMTNAMASSDYTLIFSFYAVMLLVVIALAALLALGHYFLTRYFLSKKLNLA